MRMSLPSAALIRQRGTVGMGSIATLKWASMNLLTSASARAAVEPVLMRMPLSVLRNVLAPAMWSLENPLAKAGRRLANVDQPVITNRDASAAQTPQCASIGVPRIDASVVEKRIV